MPENKSPLAPKCEGTGWWRDGVIAVSGLESRRPPMKEGRAESERRRRASARRAVADVAGVVDVDREMHGIALITPVPVARRTVRMHVVSLKVPCPAYPNRSSLSRNEDIIYPPIFWVKSRFWETENRLIFGVFFAPNVLK